MQKNRNTITLLGENTSQPDLTVPDGACEVISNLRFHNGTWQSVGHMQKEATLAAYQGVVHPYFLGIHAVNGEERKIFSVVDNSSSANRYKWFVGYLNGTTITPIYTIQDNLSDYASVPHKEVSATSFGNVLIISANENFVYLLYKEGAYKEMVIPAPVKVEAYKMLGDTLIYKDYDSTTSQPYYNLINKNTKDIAFNTSEKDLYWWGEIAYIVAYRMSDGSTMSPSSMGIFCTENIDNNTTDTFVISKGDYYVISPTKKTPSLQEPRNNRRLQCAYPKLTITLPDNIDTDVVESVAVYATQSNSIIDFEKLGNTYLTDSRVYRYNSFYANNELPNQPLYLVEEKSVKDIRSTWTIELSYAIMNGITTKSQYIPPQAHALFGKSTYDYNNRLHLANVSSRLYKHRSSLVPYEDYDGVYKEFVEIKDGEASVFSYPIKYGDPYDSPSLSEEVMMSTPIISYPDYRATHITIYNEDDNVISQRIPLTSAPANNIAYYIATTNSSNYKYSLQEFLVAADTDGLEEQPILREPNRLQVSAPNNPLSYPFENSYRVGNEGTSIVAINSVADTLVESTFFGAYPLYIFTSDGIFALAAGSGKVLYGSFEIVVHDIINNPNTFAINGAVVYSDAEGLKALSGRTATLLSEAVAKIDWSNATFGINRVYNELVVAENNGIHLLDLDTKAWSRRNDNAYLRVPYIVNNFLAGEDEREYTTELYNINKELAISASDKLNIVITTRPIKFGTQGFKKLSTLIARWQTSGTPNLTFTIEGSNDCKEWFKFKEEKVTNTEEFGFRGIGPSARFFRVKISGTVTSLCTILYLDAETMNKYNYQLR